MEPLKLLAFQRATTGQNGRRQDVKSLVRRLYTNCVRQAVLKAETLVTLKTYISIDVLALQDSTGQSARVVVLNAMVTLSLPTESASITNTTVEEKNADSLECTQAKKVASLDGKNTQLKYTHNDTYKH